MPNNYWTKNLLFVLALFFTTKVTAQVKFKVALSADSTFYQVSLLSEIGPYPSQNLSIVPSATVTLIAPTGQLTPSTPTSQNGFWTGPDVYINPVTQLNQDYFVFTLSNPMNDIQFTPGLVANLFTFTNGTNCAGAVELMDNDNDPILDQDPRPNVGNQITVFGEGEGNAYGGAHEPRSANCMGFPPCDLTIDGVTKTDITTCGANDGSISISVSNSTGTVLYSIDNGLNFSSASTFNNLSVDNYSIKVKDDNCEQVHDANPVSISEPNIAVMLTDSLPPSCNNTQDGQITVTASGGLAPYQYSINNGANWSTSGSFGSLGNGIFNIKARNADSTCETSYPNPVVFSTQAINITVDKTDISCTTGINGSIAISAAGGTGNFQYSVDSGATWVTTANFTDLTSGEYYILVRNSNETCESAFENNPVVINESALNFTVGTVEPDCNGTNDGMIGIALSGETGNFEYSINDGLNWMSTDTFSNLDTGTYVIKVRKTDGSCETAFTNNPIILTRQSVSISVSTFSGGCDNGGNRITVAASGGNGSFQYSRNNGVTWQNSNVFSGLANGDYTIKVRTSDLSCETAFAGNPVTFDTDAISIGVSANSPTCHDDSNGGITVTATGGTGTFIYSIDGGMNYSNLATFSNLANGMYNVFVRNADGTCETEYPNNPVQLNTTELSVSVSETKASCLATTDGTIALLGNGGSGNYEFSIDSGRTWSTRPMQQNLAPALYYVQIRNDDETCETVLPRNPVDLRPDTLDLMIVSNTPPSCENRNDGSLILSASGGGNTNYEYSIDDGANYSSISTFQNLTTGDYNLRVRIAGTTCEKVFGNNPVRVENTNCIIDSCFLEYILTEESGVYTVSLKTDTTWQGFSATTSNAQVGIRVPTGGFSVANFTNKISGVPFAPTGSAINPSEATGFDFFSFSLQNTTINIPYVKGDTVELFSFQNDGTCTGGDMFLIGDKGLADPNIANMNFKGQITVAGWGGPDAPIANSPTSVAVCLPCKLNISDVSSIDPSFCGFADGSITIIATDTVGIIEYSIDDGNTYQTSPVFNNLNAGEYRIKLRNNATNCELVYDQNPQEINDGDPIFFTAMGTPPICADSTNGSITLTVDDGMGSFLYSIDDGETWSTSSTFSRLGNGNYPLKVSNPDTSCIATYDTTFLTLNSNPCDFDSDMDGTPDLAEDLNGDGNLENDDTDGDSIPNYLDDDDDGDGILTALEEGGPNRGDANGDSTPDCLQSNVATTQDNNGIYRTLEVSGDGTVCDKIMDYMIHPEGDMSESDPNYDFPFQLNAFTIPCGGTVNIQLFYHNVSDLTDFEYRKYGPLTPGGTTSVWYDFPVTYSQVMVGGDMVGRVSFQLTDGQRGDATGVDNMIVDPGGIAMNVNDGIGCAITYSLTASDNTYSVSLTSDTTIASNNNISDLAITLRAPTGIITAGNIVNADPNVIFELDTTYIAPAESPNYDYLVFKLSPASANTTNVSIIKDNTEALFSFDNVGGCANDTLFLVGSGANFTSPTIGGQSLASFISINGWDAPTCVGSAGGILCTPTTAVSSSDTLELGLYAGLMTNICLDTVIQLPNGVGNVSVLTPGALVTTNVSSGDSCVQLMAPNNFTGSDLVAIEFCDNVTPAICDTIVLRLSVQPPPTCLINYFIEDSSGTFKFKLVSDTTWTAPLNEVISAQFTIRTPMGSFELVNLQNGIGPVNFDLQSTSSQGGYDYLNIVLQTVNTQDIPFVKGDTICLFSFENGGACTNDSLYLIGPGSPVSAPEVGDEIITSRLAVQGYGGGTAAVPICVMDRGVPLCTINPPTTDTVSLTLEQDDIVSVCIDSVLQLLNKVGTASICGQGTDVDVSVTNNDSCVTITTDSQFVGTELLCVVHCDSFETGYCDTTYFSVTVEEPAADSLPCLYQYLIEETNGTYTVRLAVDSTINAPFNATTSMLVAIRVPVVGFNVPTDSITSLLPGAVFENTSNGVLVDNEEPDFGYIYFDINGTVSPTYQKGDTLDLFSFRGNACSGGNIHLVGDGASFPNPTVNSETITSYLAIGAFLANGGAPSCVSPVSVSICDPVIPPTPANRDTLQFVLDFETARTVCIDSALQLLTSVGNATICGQGTNVAVAVTDGDSCVTLTPVSGFSGNEVLCVVHCDAGTPTFCDTTILLVTVNPDDITPPPSSDDTTCHLTFDLELVNGTYIVSVTSDTTITNTTFPNPTFPNPFIPAPVNSMNITLRAPTGQLSIVNQIDFGTGREFVLKSSMVAPPEDPNFDYFIFGLNDNNTPTINIPITKDSTTALFSFQNFNCALDSISLVGKGSPFTIPTIGDENIASSAQVNSANLEVCVRPSAIQPPPLAFTTTSTNPTTGPCNDGTITITATGGTGIYDYSIDGGTTWQFNGNFTGLANGNYQTLVRSTDSVCIGTIQPVILNNPDCGQVGPVCNVVINSIDTINATCSQMDGRITINATGDNLQYSINTGATFQNSNVFDNVAAGIYNIVVRDSVETTCEANQTIILNGTESPVIQNIVVSDSSEFINGAGIITIFATDDCDLQYSINGGANFFPGNSFTGLGIGTYTIVVRGCTASCAVTGDTITFEAPPVCSVNAGADQTICEGIAASLSATGSEANFSWSPTAGLSCTDCPNPMANPDTTTTYVVTNSGNGCTSTDTIIINVAPSVTADFTFTTNCDDFTVDFTDASTTAGTITAWSWDFGDGSPVNTAQNPAHTYAVAGSYTVELTVTTSDNCQNMVAQVVPVGEGLIGSVSNDTTICANDCVPLMASGGTTYQWAASPDLSATDIPNPIACPATTTTYYVTISDGTTCSTTDSVTITIEEPTIGVSAANASCAQNDGSITIFASLPSGHPLEFQIVENDSVWSNSNTFSDLAPGDYNVRIRKVGGGCVRSFANNPVTISSASGTTTDTTIVNAGMDQTICAGDTVFLSATGTAANFNWSPAEGLSCTDCPNPIATPTVTTAYVVTSSGSGCTVVDTVTITVVPNVTADFTSTTSCNSLTANFMDASTTTGTIMAWSWDFGDGSPANTSQNPAHTYAAAGTYMAMLTVTTSDNCQDTITKVVLIEDGLVGSISDDQTICAGDCVTLMASGGTIYQWATSPDLSALDIPNPMACPTATTTYYVTISDGNLCSTMDSVTITVDEPTISVSTTGASCEQNNGSIIIAADLPNGGALEYQIIESNTDWFATNTFTDLAPGDYNVRIRTADGGCVRPFANNPITIDALERPSIDTVLESHPTDCNLTDGRLEIMASGANALIYSINSQATWSSSPIFTNLTGGTYQVNVAYADTTCITPTAIVNLISPEPIDILEVADFNPTTCGSADGRIVVLASMINSQGVEYSLDGINWQASNTFENLAAGAYTVFARKDDQTCLVEWPLPVVLQPAAAPTISEVTTVDPNGFDLADGEIFVNASGDGTIEYSIDSGVTWQPNPDFIGLDTGSYFIFVRYLDGSCVTPYLGNGGGPVVLRVGECLRFIDVFSSDPQGCGSNDGSIVVITDPVDNVEYSVNNGADWQDFEFFDNLSAGTYTILARRTDISCEIALDTTVTLGTGAALEIVGVDVFDRDVCNNFGGEIFINTNIFGNLEFSIDGGSNWQPENFFPNIDTGTYTVVVRSVNLACQVTWNEPVVVRPVQNAAITNVFTNNPTSCGTLDGSLFIETNVGFNTEYSIDDGVTWSGNNQFFNLRSGTYNIKIRTGSCEVDYVNNPVTLGAPNDFTVINPIPNAAACIDTLRGLSVTLSDNIANYTVNSGTIANPVLNGATFTFDVPVTEFFNEYQITFVNNIGCEVTETFVIFQASDTEADFVVIEPYCKEMEVRLLFTGTATPMANLIWELDGGILVSSSPATMTEPAGNEIVVRWDNEGSRLIKLTVDDGGCTDDEYESIFVRKLPLVNAGPDVSICMGNCVQLNGTGTGVWYEWSPTTGLDDPNLQNPTVCPTETTTYTLTVMSADGCVSTDEVTVNVETNFITISPDVTICEGESTTLSASGADNYTWTSAMTLDNPNSANPVASPVETTTYSVFSANENGCMDTATVTVFVIPTPEAVACEDKTICRGDSIQLVVTTFAQYSWSPTNTLLNPTSGTPIAFPTETTTYTVTVTDENGCMDTDEVVVFVNTPPTVTASGATTICVGSSAQLGATGAIAYSWSPTTGLNNPNIATPIATPLVTTTYMVTGTDAGGCTSTDLVTINVTENSGISAGSPVSICAGESTPLLATGGSNYQWSPATGLNNTNIANPIATPSVTTTYTVTGTSTNGCPATATVTVLVSPRPDVVACEDKTICFGDSIQLVVTSAAQYSWSPTNSLINPTSGTPIAFPTETTTYTVTVTDENGCTNTDEVVVFVNNPSAVALGPDMTLCEGGQVPLDAGAGIAYEWSPTVGLSDPTIRNPIANVTSTITYTVLVTNQSGCVGQDEITITVNDGPTAEAGPPVVLCPGETGQLQASGGVNYQWSPTTGLSNPNIANPLVTTDRVTTYRVTVTDENGCTSTDETLVAVSLPMMIDPVITDAGCCGTGGSAVLNVSGGFGNPTFEWSPNVSTTNQATNLAPGFYKVLIQDAERCGVIFTFEIKEDCAGCPDIFAESERCIDDTTTVERICLPIPLEEINNYEILVDEANYIPDHGCDFKNLTAYSYALVEGQGTSGMYQIENWEVNGIMYNTEVETMQELTNWMNTVDPTGNWINNPSILNITGGDPSKFYGEMKVIQVTTRVETMLLPDVTGVATSTVLEIDVASISLPIDIVITNESTCCTDTITLRRCGAQQPCMEEIIAQDQFDETVACGELASICLAIPFSNIGDYDITNDGNEYLGPVSACDFDSMFAYTYFTLPNRGAAGPYRINSWMVDEQVHMGTFNNLAELVAWMNQVDPTGNWKLDETTFTLQGGQSTTNYGAMQVEQTETGAVANLDINSNVVPMGTELAFGKGNYEVVLVNKNTGCQDRILVNIGCGDDPVTPIDTTMTPVDTTVTPIDTTMTPVDTTVTPIDTTMTPVDTTVTPIDTTMTPVDTTVTPIDTTMTPVDTTVTPIDTTMTPIDTTTEISCDFIVGEVQFAEVNRCDSMVQFCLNIPFDSINNYRILRDRQPYGGALSSCDAGTYVEVGVGGFTFSFENLITGCRDSIILAVTCRTDAREEAIEVFVGDTMYYCPPSTNLMGDIVSIENTCPEVAGTKAAVLLDSMDFCANVVGLETGEEKACFVVCDVNGVCDTTMVTIIVKPQSVKLPVANLDVDTTEQGSPIVINVLANDSLFGELRNKEILENPANGTVVFNDDWTVTYTPNEEYCNSSIPETLMYGICNDNGCDTAMVEIYVTCTTMEILNGFSPNNDGINDFFTIKGIERFPQNEVQIFNRWGNIVFRQQGYKNRWDGTFDNKLLPDGTYFYLVTDGEGGKYSGFVQISR
ncbi:MAG: gliding motility-associated C-terminal domain-containing protein [Bacteroidota bacterium]